MRRRTTLALQIGILILAGFVLQHGMSGAEPDSALQLHCPLYVMEYHVWYRSPFGPEKTAGFVHWGDNETIDEPSAEDESVRKIGAVGYPLLGLYQSYNPDVIRWQLRCAHQAGIDALFVQLYPNRSTGLYLGGSQAFATILKIAAEEHIQVAAHDEVMFRSKWKAQQPTIMSQRIGNFIRKFGNDPAYLKIDGHPVYAFQYWTHFIPAAEMAQCLDQAESAAGQPIHFMINGGADELYGRGSASSFVITSNSSLIKNGEVASTPKAGDWRQLQENSSAVSRLRARFPGQKFGLWAYPGFDNSTQLRMTRGPQQARGFARQGGEVLRRTLELYLEQKPDFILLSSWNDWMENTALEPGYRFTTNPADPENADPYFYLRQIARYKGQVFEAPPLPSPDSVDPLMRQKLFNLDRTPPRLVKSEPVPNSSAWQATWVDSGHTVPECLWQAAGDAWADFTTASPTTQNFELPAGLTSSPSGLRLTSGQSLRLNLTNPLPSRGLDWYVAVEFTAGGPSVIDLRSSASDQEINYREFDEASFPVRAIIRTPNQGQPRAVCRLLRQASDGEGKFALTVKVDPLAGSPGTPEVVIRKIHLFHSLSKATPGQLLGTSGPPGVPTAFQLPAEVNRPTFSFLFAHDSENNWSFPQIIGAQP